jgi:purine catabolism regulator
VGTRVAGVLVALERPGTTPSGLGTIRNIATIAALELGELYRAREVERRKGAEVLSKLLAGDFAETVDGETLAAMGFAPGAPYLLVVGEEDEPSGRALDDEVHHELADRGIAHLLLGEGERVFLLIAAEEHEALVGTAERLALVLGVSAEHDHLAMSPVARREAVWAVMQARRGSKPAHRAVQFSTDEASGYWLPADIPALTNLVERVLGPLLSYDRDHNTALVASLRVFFLRDRRLKEAAAELFVHKHTLAYRLKRIEELTGRSLVTVEDQSELWLALKAMDVVSATPSPADLVMRRRPDVRGA